MTERVVSTMAISRSARVSMGVIRLLPHCLAPQWPLLCSCWDSRIQFWRASSLWSPRSMFFRRPVRKKRSEGTPIWQADMLGNVDKREQGPWGTLTWGVDTVGNIDIREQRPCGAKTWVRDLGQQSSGGTLELELELENLILQWLQFRFSQKTYLATSPC